jgi:hypothetical protein
MNLNNIITESINKVLLENTQLWFNQLSNHLSELNGYRRAIKSNDLSGVRNRQAANFVKHDFYNFLAALEQALKRCIQAQNINESLADYGIQLPSELLAAGRDAQRYYYGTVNALMGRRGNNAVNQYTNSNPIESNQNQKLLDLLTNVYPEIKRKFETLNQGYVISQPVPDVYNVMQLIENYIIPTVQNIRNAQGQNP